MKKETEDSIRFKILAHKLFTDSTLLLGHILKVVLNLLGFIICLPFFLINKVEVQLNEIMISTMEGHANFIKKFEQEK